MGRALRAVGVGLGTSYRADRARTVGVFAMCLVTALSGVLTAWFVKVIVDAAASRDEPGALAGAAGVAVVVGLGMLASASRTRMLFPLKEHTGLALDQRLVDLAGGTVTIEHHERPAFLDQVDVLRREGHVLSSSALNVAMGLEVVVEAVATGLLLAWVEPALLAIPLFALPSLWAGARAERARQRALDQSADDTRRARHLFELATSAAPGKELRVYGLGDELLARHRSAWGQADATLDGAARLGFLWTVGGWLIFAAGYGAAILLVVRGAVEGTATVGDVVLALTMVARINEQVAGAVWSVSALARTVRVAGRYLWLAEWAATGRRHAGEPAPVPERLTAGIDLKDVGFRYPEADGEALRDITLSIPAGTTVALVGENGAGKTTLVKLLARLYEPSTGTIEVDGVELSRFDAGDWRSRISAGFQDFTRFELLAGQTVGVGDLPHIDDPVAVAAALDRARAADVPAALPDGLGTPLGATFDGGTELSGGQWQKLALARAMMRPGPLLLLLDEPTAALDAEAEHELFSRYARQARSLVTDRKAVVVLVSHRFSTVHTADLIVVLDGGRVAESGSHAELMAAGGLYAELYELQARSYR
ncbi:MAG: ABC transporter ATP-binding protein [Acidimicrobiales bacterium]